MAAVKKPKLSARPTIDVVSPVIYGFDYNYDTSGDGMNLMDGLRTGDEVAGIGIVDNTHSGTAPQGYPWSGHEIPPGYPWEGHAPSSPNTGIEGRSPMRRGGPNLPSPSVSTAYPQIDPQTAGGYPYAPATQMGPPPGHAPAAAAFGGIDLGRLDAQLGSLGAGDLGRSKKTKSRDVMGRNGVYSYRQFSSGDIQILDTSDPAGKSLIGTTIKQGDPRWQAITNDIRPWSEYKSGRIGTNVGIATQLLSLGTDTYVKLTGRQATPAPRQATPAPRRRRTPVTTSQTPMSFAPSAPAGIPMWAKVGGSLAGTALLVFVVYQLATPSKD